MIARIESQVVVLIDSNGDRVRVLSDVKQDLMHQVAEFARFNKRVIYHSVFIVFIVRMGILEDGTSRVDLDFLDVCAKDTVCTDCE